MVENNLSIIQVEMKKTFQGRNEGMLLAYKNERESLRGFIRAKDIPQDLHLPNLTRLSFSLSN